MKIVNKNEHFAPHYNEHGALIVANSTEENMLVAEAVPSNKRLKIIIDALSQADLNDDVIFVTTFEALSGYYKVEE
jgi:hypothetical protein